MANEKRLVDANALSECLSALVATGGHWMYRKAYDEMIYGLFPKLIKELPTVDAVEVVHGRWLEKVDMVESFLSGYEEVFYECSACNSPNLGESPYCPNCGAKMDG